MATLRNGSSGDDVRKLQEALNSAGYSLSADGVYGSKTQAAVRDYQSKNGLDVDGIAGTQTLSKLGIGGSTTSSGSTASTTKQSPLTGVSSATSAALGKYQGGYTPGANVDAALEKLQQAQAGKPADYVSKWQEMLSGTMSQIQSRDPFSYDYSADPMWGVYRDQYSQLGNIAMQDTMGQAAALTGGYGSSYSQQAGQQAYNQYMQQAAAKLPELAQQAYARYQDEGDRLLQQYQLAQQAEDIDYGRYRDQVGDYYDEYQMAQNAYNNAQQMDYQQWADQRDFLQQQAAMEQDQANWQAQYNAAQRAASSSGGGSSRRSSGGGDEPAEQTSAQYQQIYNAAKTIADKGGAKKTIEDYVSSQEEKGRLTAKEAAKILNSVLK